MLGAIAFLSYWIKSHRLCHADAEPEEKIQRGDVGTRHGSVERDRRAGKARGTRIERRFGLAKAILDRRSTSSRRRFQNESLEKSG